MKMGPVLRLAVVLSIGACAKQAAVECGEGTELRDGKCVVARAPEPEVAPALAPKPAEPDPIPPPPSSPWRYESEPDVMRGGSLEIASIESINEVPVEFGQAKLILAFRQETGKELDALVALTGGLVDCKNVCSFQAKFDDGPIERIIGLEGSRMTTIFVGKPQEWLPKVKAANKLVVEVKMLQGGKRQFIFEGLSQLEWPRPKPPASTPGTR